MSLKTKNIESWSPRLAYSMDEIYEFVQQMRTSEGLPLAGRTTAAVSYSYETRALLNRVHWRNVDHWDNYCFSKGHACGIAENPYTVFCSSQCTPISSVEDTISLVGINACCECMHYKSSKLPSFSIAPSLTRFFLARVGREFMH